MSTPIYIVLLPLLLLAYYVVVRLWLTRHIQSDAIVVQYRAPEDLSPAELRLIDCGCTDAISIAAVVAQLGHKRALSVVRRPDGSFLLQRKMEPNDPVLTPEERIVMLKIFDSYLAPRCSTESSIRLSQDVGQPNSTLRTTVLTPTLGAQSAKQMSATTAALHELAEKAIGGKYYRWNFSFVLAGMIATLLFGCLSAFHIQSRQPLLFLTVWYFFIAQIVTAMLSVNGSRMKLWARPAFLASTVIMLAIVIGFAALMARNLGSPEARVRVGAFALMIAINSFFIPILRTATPAGLVVKQKIAGYRQFLQAVEADQLDRLANYDYDPLSNEHLPYAIALGVRESWGNSLEQTTATASTSV